MLCRMMMDTVEYSMTPSDANRCIECSALLDDFTKVASVSNTRSCVSKVD